MANVILLPNQIVTRFYSCSLPDLKMKNITTKIISALCASIVIGCAENPPKLNDLLVGTYTGSGSEGIYRLSFDPASGELSNPRLATAISNPSYVTMSEDKQFVYSVGERESGVVAAYKWNDGKDTLRLINQVNVEGSAPCYIDYSDGKKMIAVANYVTGNATFFKVSDNGSLSGKPSIFQHYGSGPNKSRQKSPHAHCSLFSKDSRFVYVVDLGIDRVMAYPVEDTTVLEGFSAFELQPGDGPRHLVFHPHENFAFIVNELSNTVVSVRIDPATGKFKLVDRVSTLPDDFTEHSQCADIHITNDGKYLYASNRGHNSIAMFSVTENAELERIGVESTRGDWPRNFTLSPDEKFLIVANERSDNIVTFSLDKQTGKISYTGNEIALSKPVCLKF